MATPNSKPINNINKAEGIKCSKTNAPFQLINIDQAKPAITFRSVWPAIIFANKRTGKLITRKMYDTSSIGTNKGTKAKLAPLGNKRFKNFILCFLIPMILKPM